MVRTSYLLNLDSELLKQVKIVCLIEETNMKELLIRLLTEYVAKYDIPEEQ